MSIKSTLSSPKDQKISETLQRRFGENFLQHADLRFLSYIKIGGTADFVVTAHTVTDLMDAAKLAFGWRLPYRVIGSTTGCLFSDVGFPGLLIINRCTEVMQQESSRIFVQSGLDIERFLNWAATRSLGGLEFLAGMPGTVGGMLATEAGYGGKSIRSFVKNIAIFWPAAHHKADEIVTLPNEESVWQLLREGLTADTPFPPIVVSATIQASQIHQDTLVRRLQTVRQQRPRSLERTIGYLFYQAFISEDRQTVIRLKASDLRLDSVDPNIITYHSRLKTAAQLRGRLDQFRLLASQAIGRPLDYRFSYLGYWPDKEGNEKTDRQNAESFSV